MVGVLIGAWLNRYYEARRDKTEVLKILLTYRYDASNSQRTNALNCIPIIFSKDVNVCAALDKFKQAQDGLTDNLTNPMVSSQKYDSLNDAYIKLIEEVATNLGLKTQLSWDKLKNPYIPKCFTDISGNTQWY